ncbi:MAG: hypothetical protein ACLGIN_10165 [Candidatus Sericytochromatia bacterium]
MENEAFKSGRQRLAGLTREQIRKEMKDRGQWTPTPEQAQVIARQEALEAEAEARAEVRVDFKWNKGPLDAFKRAAELAGVPYQTYMKVVLYERALSDLERAKLIESSARQV